MTPMPDVVLLCGGRGRRLGALTASTPKPLLPVGGAPFLLRRLQALQQQGCRRVILSVQYLAEQFHAFARTYAAQLPTVVVVEEPSALGTGGALRFAVRHAQTDPCVVMNGDSWFTQPLAPVIEAHRRRGVLFTLVAIPAAHVVAGGTPQKGLVSLGPDGEIIGFSTGEAESGWVNAGCYVVTRALPAAWPDGAYSLEQQFMRLVPLGQARAFRSDGRLLDIGMPACFAQAARAIEQMQTAAEGVLG